MRSVVRLHAKRDSETGQINAMSAGNEATDARNFSPRRVLLAITVGASDITNAMG
jgi:hypothetical protein